jgi:hypothetical protein
MKNQNPNGNLSSRIRYGPEGALHLHHLKWYYYEGTIQQTIARQVETSTSWLQPVAGRGSTCRERKRETRRWDRETGSKIYGSWEEFRRGDETSKGRGAHVRTYLVWSRVWRAAALVVSGMPLASVGLRGFLSAVGFGDSKGLRPLDRQPGHPLHRMGWK